MEQIIALHTAIVDKIGKQPYFEPHIKITANDYQFVCYIDNIDDRFTVKGDSVEDVIAKTHLAIAAMPTEKERDTAKFVKSLQKLLETAPPHLDTAPLRQMLDVMHENQIEDQSNAPH